MKKTICMMSFGLLLAFFVTGCGDGRIDGSSPEALDDSMTGISKCLQKNDADKAQKFTEAVLFVFLDTSFSNNTKTPEEINAIVREKLDGKNADEVITMVEEMQKTNMSD